MNIIPLLLINPFNIGIIIKKCLQKNMDGSLQISIFVYGLNKQSILIYLSILAKNE